MFSLYKKNGRLTKISDNDNSIRSNEIVGYFYAPPTESFNFTIFSNPLDPEMNHRRVSTSPVILTEETNDLIISKPQILDTCWRFLETALRESPPEEKRPGRQIIPSQVAAPVTLYA